MNESIGVSLHLARTFFRMFMRDRQAIMLSLVLPVALMAVFGFVGDRERSPVPLSVANHAGSAAAQDFLDALGANPMFEVETGEEAELRERLAAGDATLVLVLPDGFEDVQSPTEIVVYVDAAQVRLLSLILPALEQALLDVERTLRGTEPLFSVRVEDVQARSSRYVDFLLPGILAFTLMQISIAGSGFNIVEYRRKGILKRLFVTPLRPREFIAAICLARLGWVLMQLTFLLAIAMWLLEVRILGHVASLYLVIVLGTIVFLCMGFCVGSLAKTQQGVGAIGQLVIMPQLFLSGVFFPIDLMPDMIQPIAQLLPLSFVVGGMREIANNGASLVDIASYLGGIAVWLAITFGLATRLFVWKEVAE